MTAELKIYREPVVTILSAPRFYEPEHMPVSWVGEASDGEKLSEFAGRLCYMSQHNPAQRSNKEYLTNIFEQAHGSVIEHANYSLLIEGVSRSLTHELVRHRAGMAYSQLSQRYVDESDTAFVMPPQVQELPFVQQHRWKVNMQDARDAYEERVEELMELLRVTMPDKTLRRKRAREAGRSVLPNATETKLVATGNVRAWRHIITMRGNIGADLEIQRWAHKVVTVLDYAAPNFFGDFTFNDEGSLVPAYNKV